MQVASNKYLSKMHKLGCRVMQVYSGNTSVLDFLTTAVSNLPWVMMVSQSLPSAFRPPLCH